jgi:tetratricopeptide (TPR) repeat protein
MRKVLTPPPALTPARDRKDVHGVSARAADNRESALPSPSANTKWKHQRGSFSRRSPRLRFGFVLIGVAMLAAGAAGAEVADVQKLYRAGKYAEGRAEAQKAIEAGQWQEDWRLEKIKAELALGEYAAALATLEEALPRYPTSIALRFLGRRAMLMNDRPQDAARLLGEMETLARQSSARYSDPANLVLLGRMFLVRGEDPRQVLEGFYDRARRLRPDFAPPLVASAELALEKHDFAMAAENLEAAIKLVPNDPDLFFLLAKAYAPSDEKKATESLAKALGFNPRHVDSLLFQAEDRIDAERYDEAKQLLDQVLDVNVREPRAWAYLAVLANLNADKQGERLWRSAALAPWKTNPEVDHLIGRKLSRKYRFAEGAACQRRALEMDPGYLPAKIQLSQDLLRLGEAEEGWRLAHEVSQRDAYDVLAYNLMTLYDRVQSFRTLESLDEQGGGLIVRMADSEAEIYGPRVLELLRNARETLCAKYDVRLEKPTVVEIFDQQKDFAIRTFGLPGGAGFLGVCFGNVITANSPAALGGNLANWEATLWHEFCHVVTLNKTNNKMPRWLSEGISVYEERQANPAWGQTMSPRYRTMILDGELTPVSQLSGAFLNPPSGLHLQFAYYESSLVVEFLVEKYGLETVQRILTDLGAGMPINESLRRYAGSLEALDDEFAAFAKARAESLAPEADWEEPKLPSSAPFAAWEAWLKDHPKSFVGLQTVAKKLIQAEQFEEAKAPLATLQAIYPEYVGEDNAHALLARVHRELGETAEERQALESWAALADDAVEAYLRLLELAAQAEDWPAVKANAFRMLAVNPLVRTPHEQLAKAAEALGDTEEAIAAYRAVLALAPFDLAETHFRLAHLLHAQGDREEAKRQTLMALEEAPRFRAAHRLLLEIVTESPPPDKTVPAKNGSEP